MTDKCNGRTMESLMMRVDGRQVSAVVMMNTEGGSGSSRCV